jgi:DNA integrity scanning protein DisA with diadenylate cyclase activity
MVYVALKEVIVQRDTSAVVRLVVMMIVSVFPQELNVLIHRVQVPTTLTRIAAQHMVHVVIPIQTEDLDVSIMYQMKSVWLEKNSVA